MKTWMLVLSLSVCAAVLSSTTGCNKETKVEAATASPKEPRDIVDTAATAGDFKTLLTALRAANLIEMLSGKGPFTLFAPTDAAIAKLSNATLEDLMNPSNKDKLVKILTYHVLPKTELVADLTKKQFVVTVEGSELKIAENDGKIMIGNAYMKNSDIVCTNGVIHIIDTVLMPE